MVEDNLNQNSTEQKTVPCSHEIEESDFITLLGWVCIGASTVTIVGSMVSVILIKGLLHEKYLELIKLINQIGGNVDTTLFDYVFNNINSITFISIIGSIFIIAASYLLLKRDDRGRIAFIVLIILHIAFNFHSYNLTETITDSFMSFVTSFFTMATTGTEAQQDPSLQAYIIQMQQMINFFKIVSKISLTALTIALGWLAYKLNTPEIKAEFRAKG